MALGEAINSGIIIITHHDFQCFFSYFHFFNIIFLFQGNLLSRNFTVVIVELKPQFRCSFKTILGRVLVIVVH